MADKNRGGPPKRPRAKGRKRSTETHTSTDTRPAAPPDARHEPAIEEIEEQVVHAMADGADAIENKAEEVSDRASSVIGHAQHLAAEYIDASEACAMKLIELQFRAGGWARKTPLKAIVEAQNAFSRRMVEISARAVRAALRIQPPG